MKIIYTCEIDIEKNINSVSDTFQNPDEMKMWQPELQDISLKSGEPGKKGSISEIKYNMRGRDTIMKEEILKNNLPSSFKAKYSTKGVVNYMDNEFEILDDNNTKWITHNEFELSGLMNIFGIFMRGAFKKQTEKIMNQFKHYVESK